MRGPLVHNAGSSKRAIPWSPPSTRRHRWPTQSSRLSRLPSSSRRIPHP